MSPHTDPGALLKLIDEALGYSDGNAAAAKGDVKLTWEAHSRRLRDIRQAASQGSAGGEAALRLALEKVRKLDWASDPGCTTLRAEVDAALSRPSTGGGVEASSGGTTYSPIGRNADGIEVYKRDARPVDAGALEEIGPTGIEAAEIVADYIRLRAPEVDADDAANIIHILHEHGVRFALPKLTAVGESAAVAQASGDRGDLTKIAAECHRAKWQFDFNDEIKIGMPVARRALVTAFNELHRIGDMALKLRDASSVPSAQGNTHD